MNGSEEGFALDHEDSLLLQNEGVFFYYRYLLLFQLNDFERVSRDTAHNLRICELNERFAEDEEDKTNILQYKPYILRMNAMARAMTSIQGQLKEAAQSILEKAIEEINSMQEVDSPAFQFEKIRSVNYLNKALKQVQKQEPDPARKLEMELEEAIAEENYERAAELRDKLKEMK
jgi:excinuclease UvrABC helicase subunit UvrB